MLKKWKDTYLAPASFYGKIGRIALPIAGQQILNQGAGFVDTIMVSHVGGVGAVAVATQLDMLLGPVSFGINSGAYVAEIIRSGIQAVDKGQMEAARSLGMPYWRAMRRVVLPQAIRTMIPSIINQFIITLKDTSILSVIGFPELVNTAKNVVAITYKSAQVWFIVGVMYLVIITILSRVAKLVERRLNRGR